ncbi:MAG: tyrosine-type recombinase/integrase [Hyphomonadaceae bacterium]|nr:tyrosine-type recombinase/integrase [Hyphomonadaceae bacterium]GIK49271.1 MAG: integrase [Alphaproteobacteria bacterium]
MVKQVINRLSARGIDALTQSGRHADGGGLYLSIASDGRRRWTFLYRRGGKLREMGLGSAHKGHVSLAEAREKADAARRLLRDGADPLDAKRAAAKESAPAPTFGDFADALVEKIASEFKNPKHVDQWRTTFKKYCAAIRDVPVDRVSTEHILTVLEPLWEDRQETGSRVRQRIERVLNAAKAQGKREGENPARWRGHLDTMLAKRHKLARGHHAAMPFARLPAFMADLRTREAPAARALEFLILTASRSSEARGATWGEFDLAAAVWTIPKERMKASRAHRVPLSKRALAILREAGPRAADQFVFLAPASGRSKKKGPQPFSEGAFKEMLERMGVADATPHGFRSSFKDWAAERTSFPNLVSEMALAHKIEDKTEAAYRRGDLFNKRTKLMQAWERFCAEPEQIKKTKSTKAKAAVARDVAA